MGHTNSTANLALPQFIGTDKPTWLSDVNGAFAAIDTYAGNNDAALAITDAKADTAVNDAASAVTTATNAANTAGTASTQATNAVTVAGNALTVANGINSKVGVLTDLHTTDKSTVVNAINEVFDSQAAPPAAEVSYNNTVSGLTATDVQAAIDEIASAGPTGWTLAASETGTTAMAIPAGSTEFMLFAVNSTDKAYTIHGLVSDLTATVRDYRAGYYIDTTNYACVAFNIDSSQAALSIFRVAGTDYISTASVKLYVK